MQGILYEITTNLLKEEDFLSETSFVDHAFIRDRADRITDTINRKEYLNEFKIWIETNEIGYF